MCLHSEHTELLLLCTSGQAGANGRGRQKGARGGEGGRQAGRPPPAGKHQLSLHCLTPLTALCLATCWLLYALESASTKTYTQSRPCRGGCTPAGMPYTLLQHCTYAAVSARAELLLLLQPVTHTAQGQEQAGLPASKQNTSALLLRGLPHVDGRQPPAAAQHARHNHHTPACSPAKKHKPTQAAPLLRTRMRSAGLDHCPHLLLL